MPHLTKAMLFVLATIFIVMGAARGGLVDVDRWYEFEILLGIGLGVAMLVCLGIFATDMLRDGFNMIKGWMRKND